MGRHNPSRLKIPPKIAQGNTGGSFKRTRSFHHSVYAAFDCMKKKKTPKILGRRRGRIYKLVTCSYRYILYIYLAQDV